jgi:outer membrane protein assembly factor BamB
LANTPATVAGGGALAYQPGGDIFAFRGNSTTTVWHYRITGNVWIPATAAPATVAAGGAMTYAGGGFIYALRDGGNDEFWRLEINPPQFDLSSQAGAFGIDARVEIDGTDVTVLIWDIN